MPRPEVFNREDVIQRVQTVFWDKGYNGTSMQDLVDATGLNRSSIYNSFGSKHELFMLSLKDYQNGNMAAIDAMNEVQKSPLKILRKLFDNAVTSACSGADNKGCMIVNCATELSNQAPDVQQYIKLSNQQMQKKFAELLNDAQDVEELSDEKDTELLAHFLLMNLQGLRVNGLTNSDPARLKALVDQVFQNLK